METDLFPNIAGITIRQDAEGRYRLNDLHKAAGSEKRHQPSNWLPLQQTRGLIEELRLPTTPGITGVPDPTNTINGGSNPGTYVCKQLVYAYAMWISSKFHLQVINAYDALVTGKRPALPAPKIAIRIFHTLSHFDLT